MEHIYKLNWKELRLGEEDAVCGVDHALFISIIYFFHLCHSNFFLYFVGFQMVPKDRREHSISNS